MNGLTIILWFVAKQEFVFHQNLLTCLSFLLFFHYFLSSSGSDKITNVNLNDCIVKKYSYRLTYICTKFHFCSTCKL